MGSVLAPDSTVSSSSRSRMKLQKLSQVIRGKYYRDTVRGDLKRSKYISGGMCNDWLTVTLQG